MWEMLEEVAAREGKGVNQLVTTIDQARTESTLTAAIRVHLLAHYRRAAAELGRADRRSNEAAPASVRAD